MLLISIMLVSSIFIMTYYLRSYTKERGINCEKSIALSDFRI